MTASLSLAPIVVVDDSPDDIFFIQRLLAQTAVRNPVVTFTDGTGAIGYLKEICGAAGQMPVPAIVFTDLNMRTLDGLSLLRWIRGEPRLRGVKVVMLSTSENPKQIREAQALAVDRYFMKFPTAAEFTDLIAKFLG
jgi:CheY-like chemotaxis protein